MKTSSRSLSPVPSTSRYSILIFSPWISACGIFLITSFTRSNPLIPFVQTQRYLYSAIIFPSTSCEVLGEDLFSPFGIKIAQPITPMAVHCTLLGRGDQRVVGNLSAVAVGGGHQEQAAVLKDPTWADCTVLGPWVPVWLSGCRGSNWLWCFPGPGSPLCTRLCYIPLDGRGHPTTFPFPSWEIIPGRCWLNWCSAKTCLVG